MALILACGDGVLTCRAAEWQPEKPRGDLMRKLSVPLACVVLLLTACSPSADKAAKLTNPGAAVFDLRIVIDQRRCRLAPRQDVGSRRVDRAARAQGRERVGTLCPGRRRTSQGDESQDQNQSAPGSQECGRALNMR